MAVEFDPELEHSASGKPPRLFHKADIFDSSGISLADPLLQALRDPRQRVLGVIINAVDDHLAKSEQLRLRWSMDQFRGLDALLAEARSSDRTVILTSDHEIGLAQLPAQLGNPKNAEQCEVGANVTLEQLESEHLRQVLSRTDSLDEAASILGIDASTLYRKRKRLGY